MVIREIEKSDFAALVEFWTRAQMHGHLEEESWGRRWENNRLCTYSGTALPIGWLIEEDGAVVGHLSSVALKYMFNGRQIQAAAASDWQVEEPHRSSSLQLLMKYFGQQGVHLHINSFPKDVAIKSWAAFGGKAVPTEGCDQPQFKIVRHIAFASAMLRKKGMPCSGLLGVGAGAILAAADRLSRRTGCRLADGATVQVAEAFGEGYDALWEQQRESSGRLMLLRNKRSLDWYFKEFMARGEAFICECRLGSDLAGYAVCVRKDNSAIGLSRAWIADLQVLDESALRAVLDCAVLECRKRRIAVLESIGFATAKRREVGKVLCRSRQFALPPIIYRTTDAELKTMLGQESAWDPCVLDGADAL